MWTPLPAAPTVNTIIYILNLSVIYVIICGVILGFGSTLSLYFWRKLGKTAFKNKKNPEKLELWKHRITFLLDEAGYIVVAVLFSVSLGIFVTYSFLFRKEVNYFKYFLGVTIGRTLMLNFYYLFFTVIFDQNFIYAFVVLGTYTIIMGLFFLRLISLTDFRKRYRQNEACFVSTAMSSE